MRIRQLLFCCCISLMTAACENSPAEEPKLPEQTEEPEAVFAKGADISWLTEMEKDGVKFYGSNGNETECTALMQQIGFDAIRLRVWVDPEGGWCSKEDVLIKAKRAQALGMRIMIDFHYSDFFADPGRQTVPKAWSGYDADEMTKALVAHTKETLKLLKDNNVEVEWVQIGNEVNNGMLWPSGKVSGQSVGSFVKYLNAGYNVTKSVYSNAKVILHVSNGHDSALFDWFFSLMESNSAQYDVIGMSLYPIWWENSGWCAWKPNVDKCLANMKAVTKKFRKPVMLCETGMPVSEPQMAKSALTYILDETSKIDDCLGVFYWEPQADGVWKPEIYNELGWNAYNMGAFKNGKPTEALDCI